MDGRITILRQEVPRRDKLGCLWRVAMVGCKGDPPYGIIVDKSFLVLFFKKERLA
jgi:hypothetical protein